MLENLRGAPDTPFFDALIPPLKDREILRNYEMYEIIQFWIFLIVTKAWFRASMMQKEMADGFRPPSESKS